MKTMKAMDIVVVAVLLLTGSAFAQQPAPKAPAAAQDEFVRVDSPIAPEDTMPAPRLVAIAYGFIWLTFFAYVWSVRSRLVKVERELHSVSRRVGGAKKE